VDRCSKVFCASSFSRGDKPSSTRSRRPASRSTRFDIFIVAELIFAARSCRRFSSAPSMITGVAVMGIGLVVPSSLLVTASPRA